MATRARAGDGARYKEKSSGLWAVAIELPPIRWNADGKPVRNRKVQRFKTRAEADAALRDLREQKRQMGTLPNASPTVGAWFAEWLRVHVVPNKRPRTADTYRSYVSNYIIPALGESTRLGKIMPDNVRRIEAYVLEQGLSPTTARNAYHYAASAFEAAVRKGILLSNPAARVEPPRGAIPKLDAFSLDDAITLLEHLEGHPDKPLWYAYLFTAARRGEIAGLEVDRVTTSLDLSWQLQRLVYTHGCLTPCGRKRAGNCPQRRLDMPHDYEVRQVSGGLYLTRPKSRSGERVLALVEPLRSVLQDHITTMRPNKWGLLFCGVHQTHGTVIPPDPDRITKEWPKIRDAAFGPGRTVRLHDVRHSTVGLLYLAGVPEDLIQEIVGHSTAAMTRSYKSRRDMERNEDAMQKLSGILRLPPARTREIAES